MTALRLAPAVLSLAVLAAHFFRSGDVAPAALALAAAALLFVPWRWAARVVQVALALGTIEWLRTLAALVTQRQSAGEPWLRLAAILGAVALVTALSTLAFRVPSVRAHFRLQAPAAQPDA
ncbi:MAG: hypothetical protein ABI886_10500 [Betaproteobacteria bacterium]